MKRILFFILLALILKFSKSQTFTRIIVDTKYNGLNLGATWGDYDKDGDFDLLTTGSVEPSYNKLTVLYNNNAGLLTSQQTFSPGIQLGDIKWCDFNNDNILDFIIAGNTGMSQYAIQFYRGTGSGFQLVNMSQVTGGNTPCISLADYNNDGYQDLCISDYYSTKIYKNVLNINSGERDFIPVKNIPLINSGFSTWMDIDLDGFPELFIYPRNTTDFKFYKYNMVTDEFDVNMPYFRQNGQYFLFPNMNAQISFCDYNNDNYPDILVTSVMDVISNYFTRLYSRDPNDLTYPLVFVEKTDIVVPNDDNTTGQFCQLDNSWVSWGDVNSDGNFDILLTGKYDGKNLNHAFLYTYNETTGKFIENKLDNDYGDMDGGSSQFGDYDNDGDLDIIYEGFECFWQDGCYRRTVLLKNLLNTNPEIPVITGTFNSDCVPIIGIADKAKVTLSWNAVSNAKSYNVYLTDANGQIFGAPMAFPYSDPNNGYRMVPQPGNATASDLPSKIFILPFGTYYWWVQVIDARYKGGEFVYGGTFQVEGCPYLNMQLEINEDETWTGNMVLNKDVVVKTGYTLTIESTINFVSSAKLIVEEGAKLILNNGTLTNACPNDFWQGIELQGNNGSQMPHNVGGNLVWDQGIVEIKNGGTIKNAVCGIYVGERNGSGNFVTGTGGGIVIAKTGAMFKGNKVDVQFESYIYAGADNLSYFYDSFFEYAFNVPQDVVSSKCGFIQLNGVKGVSIGGCEFTNTSTLYSHAQHGVGILGTNSGFNASAVNHYVGGELVAAPNKFEGLISGVWAAGDLLPINVDNNTFINNYCGVGLVGIKNAKVVGNDFDIGTIGLYMDQCTGYTVEENTFGSGAATASCGIGVWNSGITANMLYKNTFEDIIGAPIYIEGENGYFSNWMMRSNVGSIPAPHPPYFYSGLEIRCNIFDLTQAVYDITVKTDPATGLGSISPFQGSWDMPAGNQFGDASVINNIATDPGVLPFTYYYYTNQEPTILLGSTTVTTILTTTENTCPTHTGGGNCPTCLLDDISTLSYLLPPMINPILNGNRERLMEDIKSAGSSQGMTLATLTDTLMAVSPYLADTVLMAAIGKYDTVEPTMLKQVMIANSPLTLKVKAMLDKKALPDSIKEAIEAAQTGFSARYVLEKQIHDSTTKLSLAENELMSIYLNDTNIVGIDSVIHYLVEKNSHESKLMLVEAYYAKGDSLGLLAALDSLELNNQADTLFAEYFGIMADLKTDGKSLYEIDSMQAQSIRAIAATQTEAGAYAKGVLALVYGEIPPIEFGKINVADNLTIRGHLKGGLCSNYLPIAGDTIAMIDTAFAMVENVTPMVTDAAGYFKFDLYDLIHLNTSATYSFVSKSGLVYTDTVFKAVNQWIGSDTLELLLEKVKAYFSFDTLSCLPNYEHFTSAIKYGLEPYTYDWIGKDSIRLDSALVHEVYTQGQLDIDWIVSDVLGCSDTVHINLDYLVDLPQCPTISGILYESFDCGENIMPYDTLIIVDVHNNRVDTITPIITGSDGSFQFDINELETLNCTALFNIAAKSGFALESMEPKTIDEWRSSSPLTLRAANVHQQWVATYIGPDSINDNATALDLADNIYVVGVSNDSTGAQFAVIKYDSLGVQQWVSRLDEAVPNMPIYMSAIAVDSESNVYIAGALRYNEGSNSVNILIVAKINSSGEIQWGTLYDNFAWLNSGNLSITGLYIDNENNVLVGCNSRGGRYSEPGFIIVKYDPEGNLLWALDNTIIEDKNISMNSMVVNSSDYILVSGKIASNWEEGGKYLTAVISPTGYLMWYRTYPYSKIGNSQYEATSNALGDDGLYITGFNGSSEDSITTLKYSPWVGDTAIWVKTYTAADMGYDIISGKCANKMLIDEYDNTYIYGTGWNGNNSSLYIFMYDYTGDLVWVKDHIRYKNNTINIVNSAVISNDGYIYMTGYTGNSNDNYSTYNYLTTKISIEDNGELDWITTYTGPVNRDFASCVKVSRNGNVYVTGGSQRQTDSGTEYATVKYAQCPSKANLRQMSGTTVNKKDTKTNNLVVYPNPTKDEFYVEYSGDLNGQEIIVELYTIYGSLMKREHVANSTRLTVSTRDLSAGIYFYRVSLGNAIIGKDKIVIIK